MDYNISHEMAIELLHRYLEKIYSLNKHKGKSVVKVQLLYDLNKDLKGLVEQMSQKGHNTDLIIREIKEKLEKRFNYEKITVYVDGAARGNNDVTKYNESAIAFVIYGDSQILYESVLYLGSFVELPRLRNEPNDLVLEPIETTNNTTEYIALIEALQYLIMNDMKTNQIEIFSDSFMTVDQVNMNMTTRAPHLIRLRNYAKELVSEFENLLITHIPREQNEYADSLVNKLLDEVIAKQKDNF